MADDFTAAAPRRHRRSGGTIAPPGSSRTPVTELPTSAQEEYLGAHGCLLPSAPKAADESVPTSDPRDDRAIAEGVGPGRFAGAASLPIGWQLDRVGAHARTGPALPAGIESARSEPLASGEDSSAA